MAPPALPDGWSHEQDSAAVIDRWRSPPVDGTGRYQHIHHLIRGRCDGRDFWAFSTPISGARGAASRVVAVDTGRALPRVTVQPHSIVGGLVSGGLRRLLRSKERAGEPGVERIIGPVLDDEEFQGRFQVRTRERDAVRALLGPDVRAALLAAGDVSLGFDGQDVVCWKLDRARREPYAAGDVEPLLQVASRIASSLSA